MEKKVYLMIQDTLTNNMYVSFMVSSNRMSGGYECEFVDVIAPKYYCSICKCVLREARITACCGQHYCNTCLVQSLKTQGTLKSCPHCRTVNFQSMLNWEKIREINEFCVRCTFYHQGCEWVGELKALEGHVLNSTSNKACAFVEVTCTNYGYERIGIIRRLQNEFKILFNKINFSCEVNVIVKQCGKTMQRQYFADHQQNECEYRQFQCKYCGCVDTYDAIAGSGQVRNERSVVVGTLTNHFDECNQYPLECPNSCGERNIKRKDIDTHQKLCPFQQLDCIFCSQSMLRKNVENHKKYECKHRPCTCKYCGFVTTHASISGEGQEKGPCHYDMCTDYPLTCPNRCGEKDIKRKDMKTHRQTCPLEVIHCPFGSVGCCDVQRKDMDNHMQTSLQRHLLLMLKSHEQLEKCNCE